MSDKELALLHYLVECSENLEYEDIVSLLESEFNAPLYLLIDILNKIEPEQAKKVGNIGGIISRKSIERYVLVKSKQIKK